MSAEVTQTIKRLDHWELHLHDYIEANKTVGFSYDSSKGKDCATFVADAIKAITDTDVYAAFRGQYTTETGALKAIKTITGGTTVEDAAVFITKQFNMKELPNVKFAGRGDVVLFDGSEGPAMGIVSLNGLHALFVSDKGVNKVPVKQCRRAWRVGA
jgi:hypothetical protein